MAIPSLSSINYRLSVLLDKQNTKATTLNLMTKTAAMHLMETKLGYYKSYCKFADIDSDHYNFI